MDFTVIIPARYEATRLPGKPLADLGGRPLLQWVHERALASGAARVVVATDDARIEGAAQAFGAEVVMTSPEHRSGTDRIADAAHQLGLPDDALVVNVQGDEPLMPPPLIRQVAANLAAHPAADMATLSQRILTLSELASPHVVKVVCDREGYALYFSRALIPQPRDGMPEAEHLADAVPGWQRHIGIYAYRVGFLRAFVHWPPAAIESTEMLEQLRALWNGASIHVAEACAPAPVGVDTPEDLARLRERIAQGG
ncbi:MAG: 3-deoxy-manno-octulosonate cytidylyltransferase [Immundisolibacter sp.]|uniref:3-deoxy-manno-octulosonate cytidylyltransferase n=1 Tax=Immundisolibacter sp. TaxID=1934948 RepID=UPI00199238C4|nr:3-deoxy-manno-octulosonate cytidylyltransferase [Immundisolibacter sp.]MBC7162436.1 3-deoxy-manno-octulosonate cytidylyltransferase [Immundisolibacter sp.]